ncbi:hypothetical protein J2X69_005112 [Algoriphagus sp. 4150]|uniref:histidine kinase n=1 Tax=Algoriphagus sp. 4150 TaxID=2817756 RepID=UPI00285B12B5|nr:histidine kinase [Algoriphagus sp. 4150]MDR7132738.1 hypothetical protein [Algoriphagus sp. 4150]
MRRHILIISVVFLALGIRTEFASAQQTDSWAEVQQNQGGTITALWYDIDPFIFEDQQGNLQGVEYELMEYFTEWIKTTYGYRVQINWKNATSFENIYSEVRDSPAQGLFGWSFFSITSDRMREVSFTPPYMPDINVVVTNESMPIFENEKELIDTLPYLQAYTMEHTAMEEDLTLLVGSAATPVSRKFDDYEILKKISEDKRGLGYVPMTVYVVSLQKGIKIKRQYLFATERIGLAGIFPSGSDWKPIVDEFFLSFECKRLVNNLLSKYLGSEVGKIMMEGPGANPGKQRDAELELLMKEREIVSHRLANTLIEAERDKMLRNVSILVIVIAIIFALLMYNRFRIKSHLTKLLTQRNAVIGKQNRDIEHINRRLHMRVLQAQINPHFVFNSLNDLQFYINKGDTSASLSYVSKFSRFIRELLSQANEPEITLAQEEKFLKLYLNLEKMRFSDKFDFTLILADGTPKDISGIPPLIIYHYVENALYHGILNKEEMGVIDIVFGYEAPHFVCTITDNGCGREAAKLRNQTRDSNDTTPYKEALQDRIRVLNDEVSERISVEIQDLVSPDGKPAGTRAVLRILVRARMQDSVVLDY